MLWGIKPLLWWWLPYLCDSNGSLDVRWFVLCGVMHQGWQKKCKVSQSFINLLNRNWAQAQTPAVLHGQCYRDGNKNIGHLTYHIQRQASLPFCVFYSVPMFIPVGRRVQSRDSLLPCVTGNPCSNQPPPDSPQLSQERQSLPKARFIQLFVMWATVAAYCKPVGK